MGFELSSWYVKRIKQLNKYALAHSGALYLIRWLSFKRQ
ncbi:hypothetical protein GCHA_1222 [Paraglaciecola chathamensis S18K6]|uniref:Uncharacterized protein n=1 Tax=Paraglaciecola chathamensis S18K6 TaxID=1127672 RepID=A0AAV3UWC6_9ALTE|nr:hypothetical protein GCHA_1222 [Paraglaciecola chathamensis S18K6]